MKTSVIFGVVVLAHCLAIGGIVLIQGCETTRGGSVEPRSGTIMMPPSGIEPEEVPVIIKPVVTGWPKETTEYKVKSGDTVSSIAYRYGLSVSDIVGLNGIGNKDVIRVGQVLMLPGKVNTSGSKRTPVQKNTTSNTERNLSAASGGVYVVKAGDCLSVIAHKYGVKVDDIRQANGVKGERIVVGQKLVIPGVKNIQAQPKPVSTVDNTKPTVKTGLVQESEDEEGSMPEVVNTDLGPASPKTVMTETHVVQKGEDLRRISMQWLVSEEKIRTYNNLVGNELKPGQVLLIPLSE